MQVGVLSRALRSQRPCKPCGLNLEQGRQGRSASRRGKSGLHSSLVGFNACSITNQAGSVRAVPERSFVAVFVEIYFGIEIFVDLIRHFVKFVVVVYGDEHALAFFFVLA